MTDTNLVNDIERAFAAGGDSSAVSDRLFGPGGVFSGVAQTRADAERLVKTDLFRQTQRRVSELRRAELNLPSVNETPAGGNPEPDPSGSE